MRMNVNTVPAILLTIAISVLIGALLFMAGCQPERQSAMVWGTGELPADFAGIFGTGNMARLNYVQTQRINSFGQLLAELNERVRTLEAIDPNDYRGPPGKDCVSSEFPYALKLQEEFKEAITYSSCGQPKEENCKWKHYLCQTHDLEL